jgi:hypothetical protein
MKKARGSTVGPDEIRQWNDFLYALLTGPGEMSVPDAMAVMRRPILERQVRNRLRQVAPLVGRVGIWGVMSKLFEARGRKDAG